MTLEDVWTLARDASYLVTGVLVGVESLGHMRVLVRVVPEVWRAPVLVRVQRALDEQLPVGVRAAVYPWGA